MTRRAPSARPACAGKLFNLKDGLLILTQLFSSAATLARPFLRSGLPQLELKEHRAVQVQVPTDCPIDNTHSSEGAVALLLNRPRVDNRPVLVEHVLEAEDAAVVGHHTPVPRRARPVVADPLLVAIIQTRALAWRVRPKLRPRPRPPALPAAVTFMQLMAESQPVHASTHWLNSHSRSGRLPRCRPGRRQRGPALEGCAGLCRCSTPTSSSHSA